MANADTVLVKFGPQTLKTIWFLFGAVGLATLVLFQNCTQSGSISDHQSNARSNPASTAANGGGGVDGKTYVHYATCAGVYAVSDKIIVTSNGQTAYLLKQACADLSAPFRNVISDIVPVPSAPDSIIYLPNNTTFNLEMLDDSQQITVVSCMTADQNYSVSIWTSLKDPNSWFGNVTVAASNSTTGTIPVTSPDGIEYSGQSADGVDTLDLAVSGNNSLSFSTRDSSQSGLSPLSCSMQNAPPQNRLNASNFITTNTPPPPVVCETPLPVGATVPGSTYSCPSSMVCKGGETATFTDADWSGGGLENRYYFTSDCSGVPTYQNVETWTKSSSPAGTVPGTTEGLLPLETVGVCAAGAFGSQSSVIITQGSSTWLKGECVYTYYPPSQ